MALIHTYTHRRRKDIDPIRVVTLDDSQYDARNYANAQLAVILDDWNTCNGDDILPMEFDCEVCECFNIIGKEDVVMAQALESRGF